MQTRQLYYENCQTDTFSARVTECVRQEDGYAVFLDATAFFPGGGGQACDLGTLNGIPVTETREVGDRVLHLCSAPLEAGTEVEGCIDWDRRLDQMQQHSGEHIVSGIIHRRFGYHNVGFHLGADVVTIDFDGMIPQEALPEIEEEANRIVWKNLPLKCWYPSEEALPGVQYRSKRALPWPVRIVEIPGVDTCACCGVQVAATGQIGLIKLLSCVKFHQGVRIELVCGGRALALLDQVYRQNKLVSQAFSAKILETGEAARKMNEMLAAEKFRAAGLEKRLFVYTAEAYAGKEFALHFEEGLSPAAVRELADTMADQCQMAAVLSGSDEAGYSICIVSHSQDVRSVGAGAVKALQGRGGGKPAAFQGSVKATRRQILAYFGEEE